MAEQEARANPTLRNPPEVNPAEEFAAEAAPVVAASAVERRFRPPRRSQRRFRTRPLRIQSAHRLSRRGRVVSDQRDRRRGGIQGHLQLGRQLSRRPGSRPLPLQALGQSLDGCAMIPLRNGVRTWASGSSGIGSRGGRTRSSGCTCSPARACRCGHRQGADAERGIGQGPGEARPA